MKLLFAITTLVVLFSWSGQATPGPIKHVVVLMMENRSFDHMLGFLKLNDSRIDGVNGTEWNAYNTSDPNSKRVYVNPYAPDVDPDCGHSVSATTEQVFGVPFDNGPVTMGGFVQQNERILPGEGHLAMACFNATSLPVLTTLAQEFAVFDQWFSSVPGPTQVNRMFALSATSYGDCSNTVFEHIIPGYPQKTIFQSLEEANYTWATYFNDLPSSLYFEFVRRGGRLSNFHTFPTFLKDVAEGKLPTFSWVEPQYFASFGKPASDQHPDHSVAEGERLIKKVYEALRAGPLWNQTLFLITYDEHGGFYDHKPTPRNVPNPDGRYCKGDNFHFDRLGVRVPTVAVSPWIQKGTVVSNPKGPYPDSKYDHTSIPATLKNYLQLPSFLNKRDSWAGSFESIWQQRSTPRTDCPTTLPTPPTFGRLAYRPFEEPLQPLSELQKGFLNLLGAITDEPWEHLETEAEGYAYVESIMTPMLKAAKAEAGTA